MIRRIRLRCILGTGALIFIIIVSVIVLGRPARSTVQFSISRLADVHQFSEIVDTNDDWVVFLRVQNPKSSMISFGEEKVQIKAHGRWLEPEECAWLNGPYFVGCVWPNSEAELIVAVIPPDTEALRLHLEYRHDSLIDKIYRLNLSYRLSLSNKLAKFPKLAAFIVAAFGKLEQWIIEPLRTRMRAWGWRKITPEFSLLNRSVMSAEDLDREPMVGPLHPALR